MISDLRGAPSGVLRVSAPVAFAHLHLTSAVVDFLKQHPDIEVQLLPRSGPSNLVQDEIDVAVRVGVPSDTSLVARKLATDAVVVAASRSYLKERGAPASVDELQNHEVLRLSWEAQRAGWQWRGRARSERPRTYGQLVSSDVGVICDAAMQGLGLAVLPSFVLAPFVRSGRLVRLLERTEVASVPINVVYTSRKALPRRVRAFVEFLVDRFANDKWRRAALL